MKQLTEFKIQWGTNANGQGTWWEEAIFEIEASDVGRTLPHYLGHNHRAFALRPSAVGKQIVKYRDDSGWQCWVFHTGDRV